MDKYIVKESVRNFVEFCLKTGDIDNRFSGKAARAVEGTKAHIELQKNNQKRYPLYQKEVYLSHDFITENVNITIEGRADGIIHDGDSIIIEEIKSTYVPYSLISDKNILHLAQAQVYAYIYAENNNIDEVTVRLSYVQLETYEIKSFERKFTIIDLKKIIEELISKYIKICLMILKSRQERNRTIKELEFPFESFRKGQKKLLKNIYFTIKEKKVLFAQAPTGIGKTISAIFASLKSIEAGFGERILYLVPKETNKKAAQDTFSFLRSRGIKIKTIVITGKEKICLNDKCECNPEACIYASKYYDKIRDVINEIIDAENDISKEIVLKYAEKYNICPFELSLDLSKYCDAIICDYNYLFDPGSKLTFIQEMKGNIVLIDEAHNLASRAREMYSINLFKSNIMKCRNILKGKSIILYRLLGKINSEFINLRHICEETEEKKIHCIDKPEELIKQIKRFVLESEDFLSKEKKLKGYDEILDLYFDFNRFMTVADLYDNHFCTCIEIDKNEVRVTLFCIDPSLIIRNVVDKCESTIFFSATLSPFTYYINIYGCDPQSYRVKLPSAFEKENLKVSISPIDIRYRKRQQTLDIVAEKIATFMKEEQGNYMIFSPSYVYMDMLYKKLESEKCIDNKKLIYQKRDMNEEEKKKFIDLFKKEKNIVGICVIGGSFSEGIDLPDEQLKGCIVVGIGYPKISFKNEIIKEFFKEEGLNYAYLYPGIIKVIQAVGRVIRTETDKGRALLIDDRYLNNNIKNILPQEWFPMAKY
ncbi:helicase C-terminal domain-containing protein [Clostridium sp. BJN0001]|uniref:helicase C-terminal domain-containing protein n=1 Tax=Clostridium sp. BJN0001 TaxID=2930219 RepID=UPI001FD54F59|nr:helicase C-terminal domain-containing protein [Clostridium sp. BJN0001]